jgi:hypothetical protein
MTEPPRDFPSAPRDEFREMPSGVVILAEIGKHQFSTVIKSVWGFSFVRDAWSVALIAQARDDGQWSGNPITCFIRQRADKQWILAESSDAS